MHSAEVTAELLPFLSADARPDVRATAVHYLVGVSGSPSGCSFLASDAHLLEGLVTAAQDTIHPGVMKDAIFALINISGEESATAAPRVGHDELLLFLLRSALRPDFVHSDLVCLLLANLTRERIVAERTERLCSAHAQEVGLERVLAAFTTPEHNPHAKLHYLASLISNLSQLPSTRRALLHPATLARLFPFIGYQDSVIRRGGVVATIQNFCFDTEIHGVLLAEGVLPRLLLPLAGGEELDEEDTEHLPLELQYLEPDKQRESDPEIRTLLLHTLFQLCTLRENLERVKAVNAYVILQKLHLWETDPTARHACEQVVQLLIADDITAENLREVALPATVERALHEEHTRRQAEIAEETRQLAAAHSPGQSAAADQAKQEPKGGPE